MLIGTNGNVLSKWGITALQYGAERGGLTAGLLEMLIRAGAPTAGIIEMDLSHINLSKVPECLIECRNIEHLDLSNNRLKDLPNFLIEMPHLSQVYLKGNSLERLPKRIRKRKSNWRVVRKHLAHADSEEESLL
jgi:hypothetical protein